jgi:surface antigen
LHGDENDAHEPTRSERRAADRGRTRRIAPKQGRRARAARTQAAAAAAPPRRAGALQATRGPEAAAATRPMRRNGPLRVFATVLVVPAIFGTVALPAYAMIPGGGFEASGAFSLSVAEAQNIDVSALASGAPVSSDAYAVTTKAEIDEAAAAAERATYGAQLNRSGAYYTPAQQAEGDDYPWWNETPDDYGGGLSPLRYYYRECVDFVAWRLNRDAGVTSAPWKWDWGNLASGSAYAWADEWVRHGWATSSEPIVGSVAWFPYNHVAYVQSVNGDGTVTIEEYNQNSDHSYHVRVIPNGSALYLYPPV